MHPCFDIICWNWYLSINRNPLPRLCLRPCIGWEHIPVPWFATNVECCNVCRLQLYFVILCNTSRSAKIVWRPCSRCVIKGRAGATTWCDAERDTCLVGSYIIMARVDRIERKKKKEGLNESTTEEAVDDGMFLFCLNIEIVLFWTFITVLLDNSLNFPVPFERSAIVIIVVVSSISYSDQCGSISRIDRHK